MLGQRAWGLHKRSVYPAMQQDVLGAGAGTHTARTVECALIHLVEALQARGAAPPAVGAQEDGALNGEQPGAQVGAALELRPVGEGAGHGLLHQVLGVMLPACQPQCHAVEEGEMGHKAVFKALIARSRRLPDTIDPCVLFVPELN
jgi:hypothetical protein